jgi:hypothetical protein
MFKIKIKTLHFGNRAAPSSGKRERPTQLAFQIKIMFLSSKPVFSVVKTAPQFTVCKNDTLSITKGHRL